MTRTELMDELLGFYRAALKTFSADVARLTRKVASLQRKLADADANEAAIQADFLSAVRAKNEVAAELAEAAREIARLRALPPTPPLTESEKWEVSSARATLHEQSQVLGLAHKDRDAWAARCENAENLLRGYFKDAAPREELDQRARLHFRGVGEGT